MAVLRVPVVVNYVPARPDNVQSDDRSFFSLICFTSIQSQTWSVKLTSVVTGGLKWKHAHSLVSSLCRIKTVFLSPVFVYFVNFAAIWSQCFAPSHCMFSCTSWMQIMKHYEVVCELHRKRSCTLWCLFLMAWTSPPSLSWTPPLWEAGTPWCPGITYPDTKNIVLLSRLIWNIQIS